MTESTDGGLPAELLNWQTTSVTSVGAKHVSDGVECQDHSAHGSFPGGRWVYAIVADGHGSVPYFRSGRGAQLAVAALRETFRGLSDLVDETVLERRDEAGAAPDHWAAVRQGVVLDWRARVNADLLRDPPRLPVEREPGLARFLDHVERARGSDKAAQLLDDLQVLEDLAARHHEDPDAPAPDVDARITSIAAWSRKAYGTTLLGVLIGPSTLYWVRIGDGAMMKIVGGRAEDLAPSPEEALGDVTPSLCDDDAVRRMQTGTLSIGADALPTAIVLTTDGIPNSYDRAEGFEKFCTDIARGVDRPEELDANLGRWLPQISARGSGDDMSVALAWVVESNALPGGATLMDRAGVDTVALTLPDDGHGRLDDGGAHGPDAPSTADDECSAPAGQAE